MAQIRFISGDGVEHEVEETSPAAAHMIQAGFRRLDDEATETGESSESGESVEPAAPIEEPAAPAPKKAPARKKAR